MGIDDVGCDAVPERDGPHEEDDEELGQPEDVHVFSESSLCRGDILLLKEVEKKKRDALSSHDAEGGTARGAT